MNKRELNKLVKQYSVELHEEYMASFHYNFNAGYYRDLLDEVLAKLDNLERETRPLFSQGYETSWPRCKTGPLWGRPDPDLNVNLRHAIKIPRMFAQIA